MKISQDLPHAVEKFMVLNDRQRAALKWLEEKVPEPVWQEFSTRWSFEKATPIELRVLENTVFKISPVQSDQLSDEEKIDVAKGQEFELESYQDIGNHVQITLDKKELKGRKTWVAFKGHVEIQREGIKPIIQYKLGDLLPTSVNLPVPYFSQRDNRHKPYGTCNVTSVAMCLAYYGIQPQTAHKQLEDELFEIVEQKGWDRHVHDDLRRLFELYGINDVFKTDASWDEVKCHLANKNPVIISGYFTRSGHIIVLRGYDATGFRVNDPYGEWFDSGYQNKSGENLHYSYDLCSRLNCSGRRDRSWAHFPQMKH
ncbi:MAG: C39 family peptidase [Prochloraceae cyanobacterium]|nr:C39 family peptidase [Prochloraceae cyanobacterium]